VVANSLAPATRSLDSSIIQKLTGSSVASST
jgi:hypothetical protein